MHRSERFFFTHILFQKFIACMQSLMPIKSPTREKLSSHKSQITCFIPVFVSVHLFNILDFSLRKELFKYILWFSKFFTSQSNSYNFEHTIAKGFCVTASDVLSYSSNSDALGKKWPYITRCWLTSPIHSHKQIGHRLVSPI